MAEKAAKDREIVIRKCADMSRRLERLDDPLKFLKGYWPSIYYRPFSTDQIDGIHSMIEAAKLGVDEIICAERGDWKTETVKGLTVYLILAQIVCFPILIGSTASDAGLKYNDVKRKFEAAELAEDYPEVCDPIIALNRSPQKARRQTFNGILTDFEWREDYCTFPVVHEVPGTGKPSPYSQCALTYRGLDGAIRGVNIFGRRPDIAICDDLETGESARMDGQIATRESLLDKDVAGLAGGGNPLPRIVIGTIQNAKCLTKRKLDQWGGKRYQGVKKWPDGERSEELRNEYVEMWISERSEGSKLMPKAHAFYLENQAEIEHGVELGNPHNYSRKLRPDGSPMEVSGFQRICNLIARHTTPEQSGMNYVLTEVQNDPPPESGPNTMGLTYTTVMSRISGLKRRDIPPDTQLITAAIDLGKYACHWEIKAWLDGCAGPTVNYGVAEVHGIGVHSDQQHVDMAIRRTLNQWREELISGAHCCEMPHNVLVDSGTPILGKKDQKGQGEHAEVVYAFIKESQDGTSTFKASKGLTPYGDYKDIDGERIVGNHWHANLQKKHGVWLYNLDTDWAKQKVHEMWITETFDEAKQFNAMALSLFSVVDADGRPDATAHMTYAKHQTSEERIEQFIKGKGMVRAWNKKSTNNHWFDTSYMNLLAALMKGVQMPIAKISTHVPVPKPQAQRIERNPRYKRPFLARR